MSNLTFENFDNWYRNGKKYKPTGYRLGSKLWQTYDEVRGCYVLSFVYSKTYQKLDDSGVLRWFTATAKERDKWTMKPFAEVYPNRFEIWVPENMTTQAISRITQPYFGIRMRKSPSRKEIGLEFWRTDSGSWNRSFKCDAEQAAIKVISSNRCVGSFDETDPLEADVPPLVRVVNEEKRLELNRHIVKIRRMLSLRARLGVFANMDMAAETAKLNQTLGSVWVIEASAVKLETLFASIDENDYNTLKPLLVLSWVGASWLMRGHSTHPNADVDWLKLFNNMVARIKPVLRAGNGVDTYVPGNQVEEATAAA